jgi:hypothetical protein
MYPKKLGMRTPDLSAIALAAANGDLSKRILPSLARPPQKRHDEECPAVG